MLILTSYSGKRDNNFYVGKHFIISPITKFPIFSIEIITTNRSQQYFDIVKSIEMWRELLFIIDAKGMGMPVIGDKKTATSRHFYSRKVAFLICYFIFHKQ